MGGNIIPALVAQGTAHVYDFAENVVPGQNDRERGYWRDVGTLDAYFQANMDTIAVDPIFSYYNRHWPILTHRPPLPPAKFVFDLDDRRGAAYESIVGAGVVISGGIDATLDHLIGCPDPLVCLGGGFSAAERCCGRPRRRRTAGDHRQERGDSGRVHRSVLTRPRIRERFTVTDTGLVVIGKGDAIDPG